MSKYIENIKKIYIEREKEREGGEFFKQIIKNWKPDVTWSQSVTKIKSERGDGLFRFYVYFPQDPRE